MLRPELKGTVKSLKDLKGRVVASNGQGSVSTYETGKMLETRRPDARRRGTENLPVHQMGLAVRNKAIDAGLADPAVRRQLEEQGLAVPFASVDELVKPQPMTIAVIMANSDWVKANPELVQKYITAWLRGAREYCQAYHGGATARRSSTNWSGARSSRGWKCCEKYPWPARDPNGKINVASMLDINAW